MLPVKIVDRHDLARSSSFGITLVLLVSPGSEDYGRGEGGGETPDFLRKDRLDSDVNLVSPEECILSYKPRNFILQNYL